MTLGGCVGFSCAHAYPHTAEASQENLPHSLKGIGMAVYQALRRFTTDVTVDAVLDKNRLHDNPKYYFNGDYVEDEEDMGISYLAGPHRKVKPLHSLWD